MHSQGTLEVMMLARHEGSFNGTGCPADCEPPRGVSRLKENAAADDLDLTGDQLTRLGAVPAPVGDRYADMRRVNR